MHEKATELCHRRSAQTDIFLYWHRQSNCLFIALLDEGERVNRAFLVPNDKGMDAFTHPFAYKPINLELMLIEEE